MAPSKRKQGSDNISGTEESASIKKPKISLNEIIAKGATEGEAGSSSDRPRSSGEDSQRSNSTLSSNENMVNSVKQKIADVVGSSRAGADKQDGGNVTERIVDVDIPTYAIDGYSDKLKRRILSFAGYQNTKSNVYALNLLPAEAEWGVDRPFDEKSSLLCKPGTNLPYVLWIVGHVSRLWFFTAKGEPVEHASIHVVPLADGAAQKARKLICNLSKPAVASTEDGWGDLRATKWLTERVRGQGEPIVKTFSEAYDAREEFRPKSEMAYRDISEFGIRDLVLLEVRIGRYRVKTEEEIKASESSTNRYRPKSNKWEKWRAQYEIHAVSLLKAHEKKDENGIENEENICI